MKKRTRNTLRYLGYTIKCWIGALSFFSLMIASCGTLMRDVSPDGHQLEHLPMALILFALAWLVIDIDIKDPEYEDENDDE